MSIHNNNKVHQNNPSQRRFFQFVQIKDDGSKIGTIIKHLHSIRKTAGGGVFIHYKRTADAQNIGEWLAKNPQLLPVRSQGPGFYIWAYKKASVDCAKIYLQQEERKWIEQQGRLPEKKRAVKRASGSNPFELLRRDESAPKVLKKQNFQPQKNRMHQTRARDLGQWLIPAIENLSN